jgi:hypothetical protein
MLILLIAYITKTLGIQDIMGIDSKFGIALWFVKVSKHFIYVQL